MGDIKSTVSDHVEDSALDYESQKIGGAPLATTVTGTVRLTEGTIVYVPAATADPQDPLNMSKIQKMGIIVMISIFSTLGLSLVSGFGGLLGFYIPQYAAAGKTYADISALMTYPTLFMGIGNLIGMPIAYAVGRRIVLLGSTLVMIAGAVMCAKADNYDFHLWSRCIIGLAAGQSEALVPMITQEIFFLHERSQGLMVQQTVQVILTAVWVLFASPIAEAITPQWWYGLGACLAGAQFIGTVFWVPETKYKRSMAAYQEGSDSEGASELCTVRPALDFVNFAPRTLGSDMRLWVDTPEWSTAWTALRQTFELLVHPQVFWALCLNGLTLGTNIAIGITYGNILHAPPYNWAQSSVSYANCGQIVTALIALPVFGWGSDKLIRAFANRRNGVHEPEVRLIPLAFPTVVGVITAILYGQGATHPESYHWFNYVWALAAYYFCFVGANIVAITYLLDSYPARAGPLLIIICAFRGIISFGVSFGITPFIENNGYDGAFNTFGGLTAALGLMAIPMYIWGKKIRARFGKYAS
ncbi:major facilitator superfamily domain-containing protein [Microdochium trichocladiopsis]|uniref:Major facilitator superfamily domain-containing protein n=1 Tax=Microdochium trichocladiopsis TaxID=1682393 RepID=A0A9P8XX18_9PEZI|nr:major facilitator superfamily domain-containing protein [Microdochium trichocladiopsis]KAH7018028.1 major facilitator superfamily domain-containing protein [Microdochium trichocladiopsis]